MKDCSGLEAEKNCFEVRRTALEAKLVESHTTTNVAVTKLSAFVSNFARFGLTGANIDEKVKVNLARVESNVIS